MGARGYQIVDPCTAASPDTHTLISQPMQMCSVLVYKGPVIIYRERNGGGIYKTEGGGGSTAMLKGGRGHTVLG